MKLLRTIDASPDGGGGGDRTFGARNYDYGCVVPLRRQPPAKPSLIVFFFFLFFLFVHSLYLLSSRLRDVAQLPGRKFIRAFSSQGEAGAEHVKQFSKTFSWLFLRKNCNFYRPVPPVPTRTDESTIVSAREEGGGLGEGRKRASLWSAVR